ncbi:MAG: hypothetical protein RIF33_07620 [Cyclobacteriaceae bacterium]
MKTITLTSDDDRALDQLKQLAFELDVELTETEMKVSNGKSAAQLLSKIAKNNELAKVIHDPVEWQKEIRRGRELPFKNE